MGSKIEEAAKKFGFDPETEFVPSIERIKGFKAGAKWLLEEARKNNNCTGSDELFTGIKCVKIIDLEELVGERVYDVKGDPLHPLNIKTIKDLVGEE